MMETTKVLVTDELGSNSPNKEIYFAKKIRLVQKSVEGRKILDVGCGVGSVLLALKKPGRELFGIDINERYLKEIKDESIKVRKMNAEELEFPHEHFDTVIATDVIEHLDHPLKALSEWTRVLKKRGRLIIAEPNKNVSFFKIIVGKNPYHKREFGYFELKKILERSHGYKILHSHKLFLLKIDIPFFERISCWYETLMPNFLTPEVFFVCEKR